MCCRSASKQIIWCLRESTVVSVLAEPTVIPAFPFRSASEGAGDVQADLRHSRSGGAPEAVVPVRRRSLPADGPLRNQGGAEGVTAYSVWNGLFKWNGLFGNEYSLQY